MISFTRSTGYRDVADGAEDKFIEEDLIVSEREKSLRPVQRCLLFTVSLYDIFY